MAASTLKPTRAEQKRQQKLINNEYISRPGPPGKHISSLEKLPVELIQHIFFFCLEANLTNASLILSKALSNESIYRAVILFAYFDYLPSLPVETALFRPATFRYLDYRERCLLQARILKSRWCTIDRIKAAMPALSRLAMAQRWHDEHLWGVREHARHPAVPFGQLMVESSPEVAHIADLPDITDTEAMKKHFLATADAELDRYSDPDQQRYYQRLAAEACGDENYLPFIHYWSCNRTDQDYDIFKQLDGTETILRKSLCGADTIVGVRCIPSWLLQGPWSGPGSQERIDFLKLLRQGLRYVRTGNILDISADALFEGIKSAILDCSPSCPMSVNPLVILLELWWLVFGPTGGPIGEKILAARQLPLELFHLAAHQRTDDSIAMELLIRASLDSIPRDDSVLTVWALRMKAKDNPLGNWLLTYMTHMDSWEGTVFYNGRWVWTSLGSDVFPDTTFTKHVGYLADYAAKARPWTSFTLNEASSLSCYNIYEYFLRSPPSPIYSIPPTIITTVALPPQPNSFLANLRSFSYIAIFPICNHVEAVLLRVKQMTNLRRLFFKLVPDRHSVVLDNPLSDDIDRFDINDLGTQFETSLSAIGNLCTELSPPSADSMHMPQEQHANDGDDDVDDIRARMVLPKLEVLVIDDVKMLSIKDTIEGGMNQHLARPASLGIDTAKPPD
ncbi:hypothetical protein DV736_g5935, partial [Chaetothyriales sp. CBS 134916]